MVKQTNCKHGLNKMQEIRARRLRCKLEEGEKETIEQYNKFWQEWHSAHGVSFSTYLKENDVVFYSAYVRACQQKGEQVIYRQIATL